MIQYTLPEGDEPSDPVPPADITTPPPLSAEDTLLTQNDSLTAADGLSLLSEPSLGYTVSLLHMDGADGSNTFTDEAGKLWTAAGDAQIHTAQSEFGGASASFDGIGDYLTTPDSDNFYLANGNWTIDFWMQFDAGREGQKT